MLWERLWEALVPGIKGGDCMACSSGDLEVAVLLSCSGYVPLHDAARDFENELLPVPEGVMMLSRLGWRGMVDCSCIGGGGEAYDGSTAGEEDGPSKCAVSLCALAVASVVSIDVSAAGVGTKKLAPGSLFADGIAGLLYDGAPKAFPPPPPPLLNVSTYLDLTPALARAEN